MSGLTRDDSSTIGFVLACYLAGAIDTAELQEWAEQVMATSEDYPGYIVDLREFSGPKAHVFRLVGFTPSPELTETDYFALSGIAFRRGVRQSDGPGEATARSALGQRPLILATFLRLFPDINLPSM
jgi:hypothetical protein